MDAGQFGLRSWVFTLGWLVGFWIVQQFPASHHTWTSSKAYQTGLPSCHMKNGVAKVCYF
jgi:hypothetical protein